MKTLLTAFFLILAQFQSIYLDRGAARENSHGYDWTLEDIDGREYDLQEMYEQDNSVMVVFGATWCSMSWEVVKEGHLDRIQETFGPQGSNELQLLFVEADPRTSVSHLKGVHSKKEEGYTLGDWVAGHEYPIIEDSKLAERLGIDAYPTTVLFKKAEDPVALLGADAINVDQVTSWLKEVDSHPLDLLVDTIAQESTAIRSFAFSEQCQARGFAGAVDEINKTLNGIDFESTADKLEDYFRNELGVDGTWDYSEEKAGKKKFYRKCSSDSDCIEFTITTTDPNITTFRVMRGAKETIYRKTDKPTATFVGYNLHRHGDVKSPQLKQVILSYNKGEKVNSLLLTGEKNCREYEKGLRSASRKWTNAEFIKQRVLYFARETERLCEEGGFGHLFE